MKWTRRMAALGLIVAAASVLFSVFLYSQIIDSRVRVTALLCRTQNQDRHALRVLIVRGAKDSRIFEDLFRRYGAPPYPERVKKARKDAGTLAPLRCKNLEQLVR